MFRGSGLWKLLKRVSLLRSGYYLAIELRETWREARNSDIEVIEGDFKATIDPWNYETSEMERGRFAKQTELLDAARGDGIFASGLEIGCAEGLYTDVIAARCKTLQVLDFSPTALERTRRRREWPDSVRFDTFDVRNDKISGTYDLIVVAGVLEYFSRPATFHRIRAKLCAALESGGIMLLETTRVNPVVEAAWWSRFLIRGRWINSFVSKGPGLTLITSALTENYVISIFRKSC
jgi:cyclopropane fatty-acyl-phospholipid synthase-like methyltransferase